MRRRRRGCSAIRVEMLRELALIGAGGLSIRDFTVRSISLTARRDLGSLSRAIGHRAGLQSQLNLRYLWFCDRPPCAATQSSPVRRERDPSRRWSVFRDVRHAARPPRSAPTGVRDVWHSLPHHSQASVPVPCVRIVSWTSVSSSLRFLTLDATQSLKWPAPQATEACASSAHPRGCTLPPPPPPRPPRNEVSMFSGLLAKPQITDWRLAWTLSVDGPPETSHDKIIQNREQVSQHTQEPEATNSEPYVFPVPTPDFAACLALNP